MSTLTVRKLLIDLDKPFPVRWNKKNAFLSAFFNSFSYSFPIGEQFYMVSLRQGLRSLPEELQIKYEKTVKDFVSQEASHAKIHKTFNDNLKKLGYRNFHEEDAIKKLKKFNIKSSLESLAFTSANEYLSIINSQYLLDHTELLDGVEERIKNMWLWHCAEEIEHRSVAFDLYRSAGGTEKMRVEMYKKVTVFFLSSLFKQAIYNLYKDKSLFKLNTFISFYKYFLIKEGIVRSNFKKWKEYMSPTFNPNQLDETTSKQWLENNTNKYEVVTR